MRKMRKKRSLRDLDQWDLVLVWDLDRVLEWDHDQDLEWLLDLDLQ